MSDNKNRDIFYGVVAVATLIVALVGATLAYFSISVNSSEGAVNAQAATVSIEYNDGQQVTAQATELIPSEFKYVKKAYEMKAADFAAGGDTSTNLCIDSNGKQVCSIYRFTVKSDVERTISATLNNEHNGFSFLSYAVRDVNAGEWLKLNGDDEFYSLLACDNTDVNELEEPITGNDCYTVNGGIKTYSTTPRAVNSIFGYTEVEEGLAKTTKKVATTTQVYDLVIFLEENNQNQNIDQGKTYSGTIVVDVVDGSAGGQISGFIDEN